MKLKADFSPIDRILASDDELVPSSGFLSAVMDRVREQATVPPPIPFPWKLAVPGMVLLAGVAGWGIYETVHFFWPGPHGFALSELQVPVSLLGDLKQAGWVGGALAIAVISWVYPRRMVRRSGLL